MNIEQEFREYYSDVVAIHHDKIYKIDFDQKEIRPAEDITYASRTEAKNRIHACGLLQLSYKALKEELHRYKKMAGWINGR